MIKFNPKDSCLLTTQCFQQLSVYLYPYHIQQKCRRGKLSNLPINSSGNVGVKAIVGSHTTDAAFLQNLVKKNEKPYGKYVAIS